MDINQPPTTPKSVHEPIGLPDNSTIRNDVGDSIASTSLPLVEVPPILLDHKLEKKEEPKVVKSSIKKNKQPSKLLQKKIQKNKMDNYMLVSLRLNSLPASPHIQTLYERFRAINFDYIDSFEALAKIEIEVNDLLKTVDGMALNPYLVNFDAYPRLKKTSLGTIVINFKGMTMTLNELMVFKEASLNERLDSFKKINHQWLIDARTVSNEHASKTLLHKEMLWLHKPSTKRLSSVLSGLTLLFFSSSIIFLVLPQWDVFFNDSIVLAPFSLTLIFLLEVILMRGLTSLFRTYQSMAPLRALGHYKKVAHNDNLRLNNLVQKSQRLETYVTEQIKRGKVLRAWLLDFSILTDEKQRYLLEKRFFLNDSKVHFKPTKWLKITYWALLYLSLLDLVVISFLFIM